MLVGIIVGFGHHDDRLVSSSRGHRVPGEVVQEPEDCLLVLDSFWEEESVATIKLAPIVALNTANDDKGQLRVLFPIQW